MIEYLTDEQKVNNYFCSLLFLLQICTQFLRRNTFSKCFSIEIFLLWNILLQHHFKSMWNIPIDLTKNSIFKQKSFSRNLRLLLILSIINNATINIFKDLSLYISLSTVLGVIPRSKNTRSKEIQNSKALWQFLLPLHLQCVRVSFPPSWVLFFLFFNICQCNRFL